MNKALTGGSHEGSNGFNISGSLTNTIQVINVVVEGATVTLTLDYDLASSDEIGVEYIASISTTKLTGDDGELDNFYYEPVTNEIQ